MGPGRTAPVRGRLTTCPEPWSSPWRPAVRRGGGTTASPPRTRRSGWGQTWSVPDLQPEPEAQVRSEPGEPAAGADRVTCDLPDQSEHRESGAALA